MLANSPQRSACQPNTASASPPRKLRDSCTDCATSKVRCSKEKPTCARCARRGASCTYMVSRRTGRASSNASKVDLAQSPSGTPAGGTGDDGSVRISAIRAKHNDGICDGSRRRNSRKATLGSSAPAADMASSTGHGLSRRSSNAGHGSNPESDFWASVLSPSAMLADSAELSPPLTILDTDAGELFDMGLNSPMILEYPEQPAKTGRHFYPTSPEFFSDMAPVHHSASYTLVSGRDPTASRWDSPSLEAPDNCVARVLDMFARVHNSAASRCTFARDAAREIRGSRMQAPQIATTASTIESAISENKTIVDSLANILDCSCAWDDSLISVMTMTALKVMARYATAATSPSPTSASPSPTTTPAHLSAHTPPSAFPDWPIPGMVTDSLSSSPVDTTPSSSSPSSEVLMLPTMADDYNLPLQHCERAPAQLVLGELPRVQRLVNALCKRLENIRLQSGGAAGLGLGGVGEGMDQFSDYSGPFNMTGAALFSVPTFFQLEEDLRRGLRNLSGTTVDVLRGL